MSTLNEIQLGLKRALLAGTLALPQPVKEKLAGTPVVRDGQQLSTDVQLMLRLQKVAREDPAEDFPIPQGRARLTVQAGLVGGKQPIASVADSTLAGVPVRTYVPASVLGQSARPTLVFFHGGGFIYGGEHSTHDAACRFLAEQAGVQVISVDYRMAPEHPFPAAYEDCVATYRAVVAHAESLKVDLARIAVGGDSAGGNLAAATALAAAREELPLTFQLLVYPLTDVVGTTESRRMFDSGFFLTRKFIALAEESYTPVEADRPDPRVTLLNADIPQGVAPAYLVTAGFDPLRDEGEAYAEKLRAAGVDVRVHRETGMIHGFLNMVGIGTDGPRAVGDIADQLAAGLSS
ncbi:MAG TPA: alpha/beta hydrolase [Nocardioides sp.]